MGMWTGDLIYGGEQLEPNVTLDSESYVLWDACIIAENVQTSLGSDGTKVDVVLSHLIPDGPAEPKVYGTFASSIVTKVRQKEEGDLPAVIKFSKIAAKNDAHNDAFVMTFIRRWTQLPPEGYEMPTLSPLAADNNVGAVTAAAPATKATVPADDDIPF